MTDQANTPGPATLASISETLRNGDESSRLAAIRELTTLASSSSEVARDSLDLLIEVMGDDNWEVRKEPVTAALLCPDKTLLSAKLVEAMGEPDNVGRRNAVI